MINNNQNNNTCNRNIINIKNMSNDNRGKINTISRNNNKASGNNCNRGDENINDNNNDRNHNRVQIRNNF